MFMSREIDIKLCQNLKKKTYISDFGSAVSLPRVSGCIPGPVYCTAIGGSSGDVIGIYRLYVIILSKMQNKNQKL